MFLTSETGVNSERLQELTKHWGLLSDPLASMALVMTVQRLELRKRDEPKLNAIFVDFIAGEMAYRRRFGGGRKEALAKAVGVKGKALPSVIDATAGLGRDAFVLACLGCKVRMFERHLVVAALLDDGLRRAYIDPEIGDWLQAHLTLHPGSSQTKLKQISPAPDVIYLDPMFPYRRKNALVKKKMRIIQTLVGPDDDADELLTIARALAIHRVVVKRPNYAKPLAGIAAQAHITTKNHRFDLYTPKV
ncbi:MAG: 16S rRNA m(2)G1516 methyltransferase [Sodalis sp. Fse]|nr:MAG: 16S rRNA m(2)G1516 methyltransferase [Sodalis sp. Fse]UVK79438.1 MAG: 16S rRNA m(2)G1516 methyltransferase [Sodalis sp. Ffu]